MFTASGEVVNFYVAPQWVPDANEPDGGRMEDYMNLTMRALSNEREYQFSWSTTKGPQTGEQQLKDWQKSATKITVYASDVRAIPFGMDRNAKNDDGTPKTYVTPGTKLTVGKNTMEVGVLIAFTATEIEPLAGDLQARGERAHGDYLARRAEGRQRGNVKRIEKARAKAEQKRAEAAKTKKSA
jgi:hypothetical protein